MLFYSEVQNIHDFLNFDYFNCTYFTYKVPQLKTHVSTTAMSSSQMLLSKLEVASKFFNLVITALQKRLDTSEDTNIAFDGMGIYHH